MELLHDGRLKTLGGHKWKGETEWWLISIVITGWFYGLLAGILGFGNEFQV
jgi:hypothetical protein